MSTKHQPGYMPWDRTGNRLLIKSQIACNKPTNYDIPDQNFVYGKITPDDPQHANQIIYKWKYHQPTANKNHHKNKDLIQTNKHALKSLLHTSSQFSGYRKSNTRYKGVKEGTNVIPISLPQSSHVYGKPLDQEDPIKLVIANTYGDDDKITRHSFYAQKELSQQGPSRKLSCYITKNHHLRKEATNRRLSQFNWNKQIDNWKLSKFKDVNHKVDTRRPRTASHF